MSSEINIDSFLPMMAGLPVLDVRSPSEFKQGHIPGAFNLPLLTDADRVQVGTTYKQAGREQAILTGFDLTGHKWRGFIEDALQIAPEKKILIHCWRGGMRSNIMAWALDLYGFDVQILAGGYKSYRHWALAQFEKDYPFLVLGGRTGSQKTELLTELAQIGESVIDLEHIAQHQGSSFGSMNRMIQPTQEQFENELALKLFNYSDQSKIWVEDESRSIGKIIIPNNIWRQMQSTQLIWLDIPEQARIDFLCRTYGKLDGDFLAEATLRISKRLGPLQTKTALEALKQGKMEDFIRIILVYYDKSYLRCVERRDPQTIHSITTDNSFPAKCAGEIVKYSKTIEINKIKR